jgi:hypothetical protein
LTSAKLPHLSLNEGKRAQLYHERGMMLADKELLFHMPLPVNVITHFSPYLTHAIICESDKSIPVEEYPPMYSLGPDEHRRLSVSGLAQVTYVDTPVTHADAASLRPMSITVVAGGINSQAFTTIFQWMLDSCVGEAIAEIPGATMTFTKLLHVMATAEVFETPVVLKEQVYEFLEKASVSLPFDDFKNFVLHAAKNHAARPLVVDSISKAYRLLRQKDKDGILALKAFTISPTLTTAIPQGTTIRPLMRPFGRTGIRRPPKPVVHAATLTTFQSNVPKTRATNASNLAILREIEPKLSTRILFPKVKASAIAAISLVILPETAPPPPPPPPHRHVTTVASLAI